jgi:2-polyprenyl-3-methyl-5-hydroxy-6-metoxy-1,4-benzoquinol methylase
VRESMTEDSELEQFKAFIYGSYHRTHKDYGDSFEDVPEGRYHVLRHLLGPVLPSDKAASILDYGCGDGQVLAVLQGLGYTSLHGIDLSEALLAVAGRRAKAELHHGNGLEYLSASAEATFAVIIAFDVLEHLTRPQLLRTCREMARTLKPGGSLLLCVPNGASPLHTHVLWGDLTHERAFTETSLRQVLVPLGFEMIEAAEIAPVAHGWKSGLRAVLWKIVRSSMVFVSAVEGGSFRGHILTTNLFLKARKAL